MDPFCEEGGPDGGGVGGEEGAVDVAVHQGGFADALGAEDDDFGFEGCGHCAGGVRFVGLLVVVVVVEC